MRVRMVSGISGGRGDGSAWPDAGGEMDVDGEEGAALVAAGLAEDVTPAEKPAAKPKAAKQG